MKRAIIEFNGEYFFFDVDQQSDLVFLVTQVGLRFKGYILPDKFLISYPSDGYKKSFPNSKPFDPDVLESNKRYIVTYFDWTDEHKPLQRVDYLIGKNQIERNIVAGAYHGGAHIHTMCSLYGKNNKKMLRR